MNRPATRILVLVLLVAACFSLATVLQPRADQWSRPTGSGGVLEVLFGDGRRLFANHFFVKADITFHSGYYPSIFDQTQAPQDSRHMKEEEGDHHDAAEEEHEREMSFLGEPRDWIERVGRNFMVTQHTHLEGGNEREILPWLKLSADLDPQKVDTYTVAAFWLRRKLGKPKEAEEFLRDGLRANPKSYEILFELGRLYHEEYHDAVRAANVWSLALRYWQDQQEGRKDADLLSADEIAVSLARAEEEQGHLDSAIRHLEIAKKYSPAPKTIQEQIDDLKKKTASEGQPSNPSR
jgi:tetratricopeptide (TPR) repeat protein